MTTRREREAGNGKQRCWHPRRTTLPGPGRQWSWFFLGDWIVELGGHREVIGYVCAARPAHHAGGLLGPGRTDVHGDLHLLVFLERQWLREFERAVLIGGFDGQGHDWHSFILSRTGSHNRRRSRRCRWLLRTMAQSSATSRFLKCRSAGRSRDGTVWHPCPRRRK